MIPFADQKYLSLESYRRTGAAVRTPVWFAHDDKDPATLYVDTELNSGKVKRIRNNPRVRVAACNMRATVKGEWTPATAHLLDGAEAEHGRSLLTRKYWAKRLADFFSPGRIKKLQILAIRLTEDNPENPQT
jgi:PPOX class probable F420-dependent enzyme